MYILLGLLLADKKISALAERQGSAASRPERVTHGLLLPKLVMVASNVRVVLEDVARQKGVPLKEYCGKQCGTYYKDAQKQESAPMSLRKACSCVMHRTSVDFFADGINFDGKITIDGSPSDTNLPEWRAVIHLNNFVAACIAAMEEWSGSEYSGGGKARGNAIQLSAQ